MISSVIIIVMHIAAMAYAYAILMESRRISWLLVVGILLNGIAMFLQVFAVAAYAIK